MMMLARGEYRDEIETSSAMIGTNLGNNGEGGESNE